MTVEPEIRSRATTNDADDLRHRRGTAVRRASRAIAIARAGAGKLLDRAPGTLRATRAGASGSTSALQLLPDPTLRWLAAASVGLGAGLHLAGAPRLISAAGASPALLISAAILSRPDAPAAAAEPVP
jgi:hypothetical protein